MPYKVFHCLLAFFMAASVEIEALKTRIELLERLIQGPEEVKREQPSFHEALTGIDDRLRSLRLLDNDNIRKVWSKVEEIQRIVSDEGERDAVSEELKLQYILTHKQSVEETAEWLREISSLKDSMEESKLKDIDQVESRMPSVVQQLVKQQAELDEAGKRAKEILTAYNEAIVAISDHFVSLSESP